MTLCKFGDCTVVVKKGEGVSITMHGHRVRVCSPAHAIAWLVRWERSYPRAAGHLNSISAEEDRDGD